MPIVIPGSLHLYCEENKSLNISPMSYHKAGAMLPHLGFLFLAVSLQTEGAVMGGSDDSGMHSNPQTIIARSPHLEWLLQRNKEKQTGGDKIRLAFFVDLLNEPLVENGEKESRKSFLDALLSEPLFDNGLAKAVMNNQKKPPEIIDIPVSPNLSSMESIDQWPEIFYPPSTNQILRGNDDQPRDFSLNTLEFIKRDEDKVERLSGNSVISTSNGQKQLAPLKTANLIESVFDIIENIPSIDDLMANTPRSRHENVRTMINNDLQVNVKRESKDSIQVITTEPSVFARNQMTTLKQIPRSNKIKNERNLSSKLHKVLSNVDQRTKPSLTNKKKIRHHLIYLFPKKLRTESRKHFERIDSNSGIQSQKRAKGVNKHNMYSRKGKSDYLRNFFIPVQQFNKRSIFKHFQYGSFFPQYRFYDLHPRNSDMRHISLNSYDDVAVFPDREFYLRPHTLVNHKTPSSY